MKVYELMEALSSVPAGATVKFHRLLAKDELPEVPGDQELVEIDLIIRDVRPTIDKSEVLLDGWPE